MKGTRKKNLTLAIPIYEKIKNNLTDIQA